MNSQKLWEASLANRAENTRKNYLRCFREFAEWVQKTPNELREMKCKEDLNSKPWERSQVENLVRQYIQYLQEKEYSCNTQTAVYTAVKSFFDSQGMPLNLRRQDRPMGCAFGSKVLDREEIRRIRNAAEHLRDKALIMFLKDSGVRESDAKKLQWKDFKDHGEEFWGFTIQTQKKKTKARGFVGPEATEILKLYKEKRLQGTQKIPPEKDLADHPVFALLKDPTKSWSTISMSFAVGTIIRLAGVEGATPHGLRKFWEQNIHVENIAYQKQMNGRALNAVERAYYWKETPELLEMYKTNYQNLTVEKQEFREAEERLRREYERETKALKERILELERERSQYKLTETQVADLIKRIEALEQKEKG